MHYLSLWKKRFSGLCLYVYKNTQRNIFSELFTFIQATRHLRTRLSFVEIETGNAKLKGNKPHNSSDLFVTTAETKINQLKSCFFVMPWSSTQRQRLALEKALLEQNFRSRVTWIDPTENTKVEVRVTCTNNKQYTLRIYLPPDFPNSVPQMIVKTPWMTTLKKRDGRELEGIADHTLGSRDGCTLICHFKPALWRDNVTLYQTVMKGMIWLEAYEAHLRTGATLSRYLAEMWTVCSLSWLPHANDWSIITHKKVDVSQTVRSLVLINVFSSNNDEPTRLLKSVKK